MEMVARFLEKRQAPSVVRTRPVLGDHREQVRREPRSDVRPRKDGNHGPRHVHHRLHSLRDTRRGAICGQARVEHASKQRGVHVLRRGEDRHPQLAAVHFETEQEASGVHEATQLGAPRQPSQPEAWVRDCAHIPIQGDPNGCLLRHRLHPVYLARPLEHQEPPEYPCRFRLDQEMDHGIDADGRVGQAERAQRWAHNLPC
mmetsp:Transcript_8178/g.15866  ORF Transcript_8178/g.15866 Transcript_8178/m.15866 type:complete len:201 (+) Transcript_8178:947-1549(+)